MRSLLVVVALLSIFGPSVHGEVLYVFGTDSGRHGIFRLDTNSDQPPAAFAEFIYAGGLYGPFGGFNLQLTASDGLIQLHGPFYYEFDESSGQLLRRFEALDKRYDEWGFHGVAIEPALANELGIEPGHYGNVHCVVGGLGGCGQVPDPFPGYPDPVGFPLAHVLLRRPWEPHDTRLELVTQFTTLPQGEWRVGDFDRAMQRFLFVVGQSTADGKSMETLTSWDPKSLNETILREEPRLSGGEAFVRGIAVSVDDPASIFLHTWLNYRSSIRKQTLAGEDRSFSTAPFDSIEAIVTRAPHAIRVHEQLFPIVGETAGAQGTFWRSDAWFFNPSSAPMDVRLRLLSDPTASLELTLAPYESREMLNILRVLRVTSTASATDAVVIESDARPGAQLSAYSRTYTADENGGTYGQLVPAVPLRAGYSNHLSGLDNWRIVQETMSRLPVDRRKPGQYRHNFGAANTTSEPVEFKFGYEEVVRATVTVPPHSVRQFALETILPEPFNYTAFSGSAPVPVWMSIVDNVTGDASFIPFSLYAIESGPGGNLAIPAIIQSKGANGTWWRTDAYGVFWDLFKEEPWLHPPYVIWRGAPGCAEDETSLQLSGSNTGMAYADLVGQLCGQGSARSGALEVRTGAWTSMVSRTYTTREDGGTYGDILPLYPPRGWPERHFSGVRVNEQFRVNVGLYNGTDTAATQRLELYRADGSLAGTKDVLLAPYESRQTPLGQLFEVENGLYGLSVHSDSGVWPWVSIVDNRTGDPTNLW